MIEEARETLEEATEDPYAESASLKLSCGRGDCISLGKFNAVLAQAGKTR